jgi:hypothetical protein
MQYGKRLGRGKSLLYLKTINARRSRAFPQFAGRNEKGGRCAAAL